MKYKTERTYHPTLMGLIGLPNDEEFIDGIKYIESHYQHHRAAYLYSRSFWSWWKDQQEALAQVVLLHCYVKPGETKVNPLVKDALVDAYLHFKLKFINKPPYPEEKLRKRIVKDYLVNPKTLIA